MVYKPQQQPHYHMNITPDSNVEMSTPETNSSVFDMDFSPGQFGAFAQPPNPPHNPQIGPIGEDLPPPNFALEAPAVAVEQLNQNNIGGQNNAP